MKKIVLSLTLALASAAFADEYTPVSWISVHVSGGLDVYANITMLLGPENCISFQGAKVSGATLYLFEFKWVMRKGEGSEWVDMPGTEPVNKICGIAHSGGTFPTMSGEYRPVGEFHFGEQKIGKYTSENMLVVDSNGNTRVAAGDGSTVVVGGDPEAAAEDESAAEEAEDETAVEAVTWGFLKSRVAP